MDKMITVVNKRTHKPTPYDIYIGRGSPLGNPYDWKDSSHPQVLYKVENRDVAINCFIADLRTKIIDGDPDVCDAINKLIIKNLTNQKVNLVCFCEPLKCHGDKIKEFVESQKYCINWFSNMKFLDEPFKYQGFYFNTVETFYQAMKTLDITEREKISKMNPYAAKKYAKTLKLRDDWDDIKLAVMKLALERKFAKGTSWRYKLDQSDRNLIEWNSWGDKFWGKCIFSGEGENNLGKLINNIK